MSIQKQTKNLMRNAIKHLALENEVEARESQVLIFTDNPDCEPKYKVCKRFNPIREITFNELLNVRIDFLGREMLATPFITNYIKKLIRDNGCKNYEEVDVLVYSLSNECKDADIKMHLFINKKPTKELTFDDLFGE